MDEIRYIEKLPGFADRPDDAHKGTFGRVLIIGGSAGMLGAVSLSTMASLRSGAGLVTFATPAIIQQSVAMLCECATSVPLSCDELGELAPASVTQIAQAIKPADIIAIGPGFGVGEIQQEIIREVLTSGKPAIVDADGINNLVQMENWHSLVKGPLVLTPHPGEFARLIDMPAEDIQQNRERIAVKTAAALSQATHHEVIIALKGAGTVVTQGQEVFVNSTGNPGMATGGSGDVLTGVIAGFSQQGVSLFEAVCLAVFIHGRAGDLAAEEMTQISMIPTDMLNFLGDAIADIFG